MTGSANIILHVTPLPEQTGLSPSVALLVVDAAENVDPVLILFLGLFTRPLSDDKEGLDIAVVIGVVGADMPLAILLAKIVDASPEARESELPTDLGICGE